MAQRFEGKSLDEALDEAASSLGVARNRLTWHVVVEKKGFLGGTKQVVVEAEVAPEVMNPEPDQPRRPASRDRGARPARRDSADRPSGPGGGRGSRRHGGHGGRERVPEERARETQRPKGPQEPVPPIAEDESVDAGRVRQWCETLFELADLDLTARVSESADTLDVQLFGTDSERLTSRGGELLDSIQVIANKALVARSIEKPIEFDSRQFKEQRTRDLEQEARETAETVRRDGREKLLSAMSPIERRIVHLALQDHEHVVTDSRGEGFFKRVAIVPKKDETVATE